MSGSSSTTSTRKAAACAGARRPAGTTSLIGDLDLGEELVVAGDGRLEQRAVAAARPVFDVFAEVRDLSEAVGIADALHAVAELAQLLEIGGGERDPQRIELFLAVAHEDRDQVFEILGNGDEIRLVVHFLHYRGRVLYPGQGLSNAPCRARGRFGCRESTARNAKRPSSVAPPANRISPKCSMAQKWRGSSSSVRRISAMHSSSRASR